MARRKTTIRTIPELISVKRDGGALSDAEIQHLIQGYASDAIPDYQMSALAMAIYLNGMNAKETTALTLAMRDSGMVVKLRGKPGKHIDKHSTGGVGDKVSICLAPIVSACGVKVPMVSGRGLGHTGGTLDKLEAIPGFSVRASVDDFVSQVDELGCALIGQTQDIAPADKRLYALRDVTATVASIPLITASILSKKLAEGIDGLVLDVKVGQGAFMKTEEDARALAKSIVRVGKLAKKRVTAILTRMESPLGHAVGNANETAEAFEILQGGGPADLKEVTFVLGAEMLRLAGIARNTTKARKMMHEVIENGAAAARMREIIAAQGGDPRTVNEPDRLPRAKYRMAVNAPKTGYVHGIDALEIGLTGVAIGAGRTRSDQEIDPAVGIYLFAKPGHRVKRGEPLAELSVNSKRGSKAIIERITNAYEIRNRKPQLPGLVIDTIR